MTSWRRFSSEATFPAVSVNDSVTSACTSVPDGSPIGDCTASRPDAVPPAGDRMAGDTEPALAAVAGIVTIAAAGNGAPIATAGNAGSRTSATTKAKAPAPGIDASSAPAATGT